MYYTAYIFPVNKKEPLILKRLLINISFLSECRALALILSYTGLMLPRPVVLDASGYEYDDQYYYCYHKHKDKHGHAGIDRGHEGTGSAGHREKDVQCV